VTFLAPAALALIGAIAVPLVLHLLRRKQGEPVEFPALRYLLRAQREFSRTLKLRNLLLMLVRIAAVLALALAAARPIGRLVGGGHSPTALAVVLDNSLSTSLVVNGQPVLARLKDAARAALARATAGDRAWLVTADGRVVGGDMAVVRDAIDRAEPFAGAGDLAGAVARAVQLVQASGIPARQLAILTDGQASSWDGVTSLAGVSATIFVPAPATPPHNRAVVRVVAEPPHWTPRGTVRATTTASDTATFRVMLAGKAVARGTAAPGAEVAVRLQPTDRGWVAGSVELEPDELRGDDVRWFAAHVGAAPSVVADPGAGAFARTAVDALVQEGRVTRGSDVVIAGAEAARRPAVLFAPTDPVQVGAANRALQRAGIPWRLGAPRTGPASVRGVGLDGVTATRWYALEPVAAADAVPADTLARAGGDAWAVAGDGYVLVASPLSADATDLPLRATWVPWIGAAISDRLGGDAGAVTEAAPSAPITRPSWARELEAPDGSVRPVTAVRPHAPDRAGVYFWRRGTARGGALVVNPEIAESDLTSLNAPAMGAHFAGAPVTVLADAGAWQASVFTVTGRRALEGTFLVIALLLLASEAGMTRAVADASEDGA
jgi:hypothetical protein